MLITSFLIYKCDALIKCVTIHYNQNVRKCQCFLKVLIILCKKGDNYYKIFKQKFLRKVGIKMELEKVYIDFEKRYGKKCNAACFVGMPIIFFSAHDYFAGCAVSAGGYAAMRERNDERIMIQYSDNDLFLNYKISKMKENKNIGEIFLRAENAGVKINGAEILLRYNTRLKNMQNPMLISLLSKISDAENFIKFFDDAEINSICMHSRKNHAVCCKGDKIFYLPFSDEEVKIIITDIGTETDMLPECTAEQAERFVCALNNRDYEKFGQMLNEQTEMFFNKNAVNGAVKNLFLTAKRLGDAFGSGFCGGRMFSVMKNGAVDSYMCNLNREYSRYYGGKPDFYVTRSEDSGIYNIPE